HLLTDLDAFACDGGRWCVKFFCGLLDRRTSGSPGENFHLVFTEEKRSHVLLTGPGRSGLRIHPARRHYGERRDDHSDCRLAAILGDLNLDDSAASDLARAGWVEYV